ncbi:NAD(P)/FAD-dependent oxidoreductase [Gordonia humi]|uniref:Putative NAD/FAD-binding protein n=1 Tax=Gordonia humi TaxID=686429 RepID=A0A840ETN0_9ACTN|nr:putative NAD/FAD-binding protein [Gordonia humi]
MSTPKALSPGSSIAVVGSGVAGLTAAHLLSHEHDVTVLEADARLGGHAHTQLLPTSDGRVLKVDTGFIVHNDRTYPTLLRLFAELGVPTQETDMSMSVSSMVTGLEYAGALGVRGLFPSPRNVVSVRHLRLLAQVRRFHRLARRVLDEPADDVPLSRFVATAGLSSYFVDNFLLPLVAAVWSCDAATAADYPARYLFAFLDHHGMLTVFGSPAWRTVTGGSDTYVQAIARGVVASGGAVRTSSEVLDLRETADGVVVRSSAATEVYDAVVVATHPHQALAMLDRPTVAQRTVLGAIGYSPKHAVLHTDESLLPRARRARASWNYQIRTDGDGVAVTYDLTRLMRLPDSGERALVTMGRTDLVDPRTIVAEMSYEHPVYDVESVAAQRRLAEIDTARMSFAGAYHGWGFHEDGAAAGAAAARRFGGRWGRTDDDLLAEAFS